MGDRRMFSKEITDSDSFLDMPLSTQALYFHLSMKADDDGFVNNPKRVQRLIGASDDDYKLLIAKSFILTFESGVIVIKHWRINNWIRSDRKKSTNYIEEMGMLRIKENQAYTFETLENSEVQPSDNQVTTICQPSDNLINSINLIDNNVNPLEEVKPNKQNTTIYSLLDESGFTERVTESLRDWLTYKKEQFKFSYQPTGFKKFLTEIRNNINSIGEDKVIQAIDLSMAKGYKGIIWDLVKQDSPKTSAYMQAIKDRVDIVDSWV